MSATIVERASIDILVGALLHYDIVHPDAVIDAGVDLVACNYEAVNGTRSIVISQSFTDNVPDEPTGPWYDAYRATPATVGQVAKCLRHYVYQTTGAPGWEHSPARELCNRLALALLDQVPGYSQAGWQ